MNALQKSKKVKIADKTVEVKKLPLGKMAALFQSVEALPKEITGLDKMSGEEAMAKLPMIIGVAIPSFAPMVSAAVENQVTKEEILEQADLAEVMDVVTAFCEVNNVAGIIERVKKIKALTQPGAKKAQA